MANSSRVELGNSLSISTRLGQLRALGDGLTAAEREELLRIAVAGHTRMALAGRDAQGQTLPPLAASTQRRRRGSGPPLAPQGSASRVITQYRGRWETTAEGWALTLGWEGWSSRSGQPLAKVAAEGGKGRPPRDPGGIDQQTWREISLARRAQVQRAMK